MRHGLPRLHHHAYCAPVNGIRSLFPSTNHLIPWSALCAVPHSALLFLPDTAGLCLSESDLHRCSQDERLGPNNPVFDRGGQCHDECCCPPSAQDSRSRRTRIILAIVRLVCTGLMIAFVERIAVNAIPRVVIGIVMAVIYSVAIIVVVINLVLHCGIERLWTKQEKAPHEGSADDTTEKDGRRTSFPDLTRPKNPTPERNIPLDPEINQPYTPLTPPSTAEHGASNRDSASTNFGNLLPRRWSFTPLSSPTDSHLSHPSLSSPYHTQDLSPRQHT